MKFKRREIFYNPVIGHVGEMELQDMMNDIDNGYAVTVRFYREGMETPEVEFIIDKNLLQRMYRMDADERLADIDKFIDKLRSRKVIVLDDLSLTETHRLVYIPIASDTAIKDLPKWRGAPVPVRYYIGFDGDGNVWDKDTTFADTDPFWQIKDGDLESVAYGGVWGGQLVILVPNEHPLCNPETWQRAFIAATMVAEYALEMPVRPTLFLLTAHEPHRARHFITEALSKYRQRNPIKD
jgi:hypothetical protein